MVARCLVTDLDRTLTDAKLALDPAALERIALLRERGVHVIVATGRRYEELVAMGLPGKVDAIVAENGPVLAIPGEGIHLTQHPAFRDAARAALGDLDARFVWGSVVGSGPRELAPIAEERLTRAGVEHALHFNAEEVMLLPRGVDKATGAAWCLRHFGIHPRDAWAIGDGENDVPMLLWAGVGIAPGNAAEPAKEAADLIVASEYAQAFVDATTPLVAAPVAGPLR